ncbi:MAG TPA: hypothetical protein VNT30_06805 [Stellaceae bacterium]|nr:hypothetical protein [Stellaceae bacterium]
MASAKKTVIVLHLAGQIPLAGIAWQALHYVLGLRRLGYDVWYIEDSGANPYDPRQMSIVEDCSYNVQFVRTMMERFDLGDRWCYWDAANDTYYGITKERLMALYGETDGLINLCGATRLREEHMKCPVRIFVDTDPVFEQAKVADGNQDSLDYLGRHTHHFTYAENLGSPDCLVPVTHFDWKTTRPPVLVDLWDAGCVSAGPFFTSVATWENKGKDIKVGGETYRWSKHVNFLRFLDLPRQVLQPFRLAMAPPTPEVESRVREGGWDIVSPVPVSADMQSYRDFVVSSRGEFTVAKDIYVRPKTGWFSDRSVCYLAAGRPVITQETGFSKFIETGRGLFPFETLEEIRDAIAQINGNYAAQSIGAIEVAYEFFDADRVLRKLVIEAGL